MNTDTGEIKRFSAEEIAKGLVSPWVLINEPNPNCATCHGKGSVPGVYCKFKPCPDCTRFKWLP